MIDKKLDELREVSRKKKNQTEGAGGERG